VVGRGWNGALVWGQVVPTTDWDCKSQPPFSHQPCPGIGEFRAFAAVEGDVGGEGLVLEAVAGVNQAVGAAVDVGIVDLRGVADHDELGVARHAGDDGFRLLRGELLGFVENEEAVGDGAAADVAERLDLEDALLHEDFVGFLD